MQAIASDIIVNQAVANGSLPISTTFNNSSSNNVSFADMLSALKPAENSEPVQKPEYSSDQIKESEYVKKSAESEKSEKTDSPEKAKQEEKPVEKADQEKDADNSKKVSSKSETASQVQSKNDEKTVKAGDEKLVSAKDEKKPVDAKKTRTDEEKKALLERQKFDQLIEEAQSKDAGELSKTVSSQSAVEIASLSKTAANLNEESIKNQNENTLNDISELTSDNIAGALNTDGKSKLENTEVNPKEKISVVDLRTKVDEAETKPADKTTKSALKVEYNSNDTATVTMEFDQQQLAAGENILSLDNQTAAATGSDFQAMVSNQLQASAPDFVRTGTILLKDNDKGTINLVLHPDDLGNVKIHLSMDGKTISAHITVNTKEALEVFKDNAQTLREAFAKNGYDTANFDVSYNGNSNGQNANQNFEGRYDGMEYIARQTYNDYLGGETDGYIQNELEKNANSEYLINIVA